MSHKYPLIAAAVAAAFASSYAAAAVPTLAQAASPAASLVIAGSSAAQSGLFSAIETDLCGGAGNALVVKSAGGSGNFLAVSCALSTAVAGTPGITAGSIVTVYYRTEGGSVVGALPIVSGKQIKRLNLADTTDCAAVGNTGTCTVNGTTSTSGTVDSWTGAVTEDTVQLGVTDVEPGQLTNLDSPSNYSAAVFGTASPTALAGLSTAKLFQQVFGLAVNTSGSTGLPTTTVSAGVSTINLSKEAAANILLENYTDWANVPSSSGGAIASTSTAITRIDREPGSGTRTATNIYFLNYQCGGSNAITNASGEQLNFSTADELTQANGTPGAIAYTSIDQILNPSNGTKWTNLALVQINGTAPSTLAAAAGLYDFWYEATLVPNSAVGTNTAAGNLISYIEANVPQLLKAPQSPDVNVIPNIAGNTSKVPLSSNGQSGTKTVYVNPYTRNGNSCNVPGETNQ
jgi:hypothetical protein